MEHEVTSTNTAQRQLIEALAALGKTAGGTEGLLIGLPIATEVAEQQGLAALAQVYRRLGDLTRAVAADQKGARHG
ncbi:hypothetical protein [uncultured Nocardioides sp.]|uniref:hypothetical protein n=1 Tax=uncultured Nocardioides sp. TaxID=198441 RepID=UPI0030F6A728